jgi:hypothetical protein
MKEGMQEGCVLYPLGDSIPEGGRYTQRGIVLRSFGGQVQRQTINRS